MPFKSSTMSAFEAKLRNGKKKDSSKRKKKNPKGQESKKIILSKDKTKMKQLPENTKRDVSGSKKKQKTAKSTETSSVISPKHASQESTEPAVGVKLDSIESEPVKQKLNKSVAVFLGKQGKQKKRKMQNLTEDSSTKRKSIASVAPKDNQEETVGKKRKIELEQSDGVLNKLRSNKVEKGSPVTDSRNKVRKDNLKSPLSESAQSTAKSAAKKRNRGSNSKKNGSESVEAAAVNGHEVINDSAMTEQQNDLCEMAGDKAQLELKNPDAEYLTRIKNTPLDVGQANPTANEACQVLPGERRPEVLFHKDGCVVLLMEHHCEVAIKGRARISCWMGEVDITGYRLGERPMEVYSPDCNSLVTIITTHGLCDPVSAVGRLQNIQGVELSSPLIATVTHRMDNGSAFVVLKFENFETSLCRFISTFRPYESVFKLNDDKSVLNRKLQSVNVTMPTLSMRLPSLECLTDLQLHVFNAWTSAIQTQDRAVILACGGKGSGKSTTNRFIINTALNSRESVYYLECDIGQTEFTPPGVVSLVHITQPVFGSPFCHQRTPVCAYFYGGVSPRDEPDHYLKCVVACVQHYKQVDTTAPLVVNTMGWIKDLGWQLLVDTIFLTSPSMIVQLTTHDKYNNLASLDMEALNTDSWSYLTQCEDIEPIPRQLSRRPKFVHIDYPISSHTSHDFKLNPAEYRNLSILSHLGNDLEAGMTLTSTTPRVVPWKDVCVHVSHMDVPRKHIMYSLNASLVALCAADVTKAERLDEDGPMFLPSSTMFNWIGFGIVRCIDPVKKQLYIVTSLSDMELSRVNAVVKGGVVIPEHLLTLQKGKQLLYTDEVISTVGIHCNRPRKRMARNHLRPK